MENVLLSQAALQLEMSNRLLNESLATAGEITKARLHKQIYENKRTLRESYQYISENPVYAEEIAKYRAWVKRHDITNPATLPEGDDK